VKQASYILAAMGFFVVAVVGMASGVPPHVCSMRALGGALAMYVVGRLAGGVVVRLVADAAVRGMAADARKEQRDNSGE
jgi:hypothetical protein